MHFLFAKRRQTPQIVQCGMEVAITEVP